MALCEGTCPGGFRSVVHLGCRPGVLGASLATTSRLSDSLCVCMASGEELAKTAVTKFSQIQVFLIREMPISMDKRPTITAAACGRSAPES